jgi:hypothetical protein
MAGFIKFVEKIQVYLESDSTNWRFAGKPNNFLGCVVNVVIVVAVDISQY